MSDERPLKSDLFFWPDIHYLPLTFKEGGLYIYDEARLASGLRLIKINQNKGITVRQTGGLLYSFLTPKIRKTRLTNNVVPRPLKSAVKITKLFRLNMHHP